MSRRAIPLSRKWNCWSSRSRLYFLLFSFLFQSFITYDSFFFLFVSLLLGAVVLPSVRWSKRFHPLENGTAGQAGRGFTFFFFCKSFITYNSFLVSLLLGVVVLPSIRRGQWLHAFQNGATRQAGRGGPSLLGPYDCGLYRDCTFFLYFLHVFIFLGAVVLPSICRSKRLHSLENGIAGETSRGGPSLLGPDDCGLYFLRLFLSLFFNPSFIQFLGAVMLPSICRSKRFHSLENGIAGETSRGGPSLLGPDDCGRGGGSRRLLRQRVLSVCAVRIAQSERPGWESTEARDDALNAPWTGAYRYRYRWIER